MIQIIKILGIFLTIILVNFLLLTAALQTTDFSGGQIGMLPIASLLISGISLILSIVIVMILKSLKKLTYLKAILLYFSVNIIVYIFAGLNLFNELEFFNNPDTLIIIAFILTLIPTLLAYSFLKSIYPNDNGFS